MKVQHRQRSHFKHNFPLLCLILLSSVLVSSCLGMLTEPSFSKGIRVHQDEAVTNPGVKIPVPLVPVAGAWIKEIGPPSFNSGNKKSFDGETDTFGDFDEPNAIDDATWGVHSGPLRAPPCPIGNIIDDVPIGGEIFKFTCVGTRQF